MFFILRKTYDVKERRELLLSLFEIFDVEGIDSEKLMKGLKNETFLREFRNKVINFLVCFRVWQNFKF